MRVYKGFHADMTCTLGKGRYQYRIGGEYVEEKADAHKCGFHAAENPLDCLKYYPDIKNSVYCECEALGDISEDGSDTKVACTKLRIIRQLTKEELVLAAIIYLARHPGETGSQYVMEDRGSAVKGICIVCGRDPLARGGLGDVLGHIQYDQRGKICAVSVQSVDGKTFLPGVWYDIDGKEVQRAEEGGSPEAPGA